MIKRHNKKRHTKLIYMHLNIMQKSSNDGISLIKLLCPHKWQKEVINDCPSRVCHVLVALQVYYFNSSSLSMPWAFNIAIKKRTVKADHTTFPVNLLTFSYPSNVEGHWTLLKSRSWMSMILRFVVFLKTFIICLLVSFLEYLFSFWRYSGFFVLCKWGKWWCHK